MIDFTDVFTVREIADDVLGGKISTTAVRHWIHEGIGKPRIKLKAHRLGTRILVQRDDLIEFLEAIRDPELYRRQQKSRRVTDATRRLEKAGC